MTFRADNVENSRGIMAGTKTYTWFTDQSGPYLQFKGVTYTVQDRLRYEGSNIRSPSKIFIIAEVDVAATADVRIFDPVLGAGDPALGIVAELNNISNTSWLLLDLGTISNLNPNPAIWELQVKTSNVGKNIRISSMDIEFYDAGLP